MAMSTARIAGAMPAGTDVPSQTPGPAFQRVTIASNTSGDERGGCCRLLPGGGLTATNATLRDLIRSAYQLHGFDRREVDDGPAWVDAARFDLTAESATDHAIDADGVPRRTWLMLRTALADRFRLRLRVEKRSRALYMLVLANPDGRLGPRLRRSEADCAAVMAKEIRGERPAKPTCAAAPYPGRLVATALAMPSVASLLTGIVDREVRDGTGLAGVFDLEVEAVEIRPPGPAGPSAHPSDTKESIFRALPTQLGLKLEAKQGSVDILVIEDAERPEVR